MDIGTFGINGSQQDVATLHSLLPGIGLTPPTAIGNTMTDDDGSDSFACPCSILEGQLPGFISARQELGIA